ncbi:unnamed protein product, partial [Owenia fusiformis]
CHVFMADVFRNIRLWFDYIFQIMNRRPELCCLILSFIVTLVSKRSDSASSITRPQPPPQFFFPRNSAVKDFPYGQIEQIADMLQREEVLFIMFYAPWCSTSQSARHDFLQAAKYMENEIKFIAINCWWKKGECSEKFRIMSFPVIYVYHHHTTNGFHYSGPLSAEHMISFLEKFLYPLTHIHYEQDAHSLVAQYDNTAFGFFDFNVSPQPPGFTKYYYAALRTLEQNPVQHVQFGVITNHQLALVWGVEVANSIWLERNFNNTLMYPVNLDNATASGIAHWIGRHKQQPLVKVLTPPGMKSLQLSSEIEKGAAVILFTPINPMEDINQYISTLRELVFDYKNCYNDTDIRGHISTSIRQRLTSIRTLLHNLGHCPEILSKPKPVVAYSNTCCQSYMARSEQKQNVCNICVNQERYQPFANNMQCNTKQMENVQSFCGDSATHECWNILEHYNPNEYIELCRDNVETQSKRISPRMLKSLFRGDSYVKNAQETRTIKNCEKIRIAKLQKCLSMKGTMDFSAKDFPKFTGLGCRTNRTLNFYVMDTKHNAAYADRYGMNIEGAADRTGMALVDKKDESNFVLNTNITKENIVSFILNYTEGNLHRHLRSDDLNTQDCHYKDPEPCIVEVTSKTFRTIVLDSKKDVLLLYYAPWCGFCASLAHVYLALARYFHNAKDIVFARINGDTNDLPWQFTADKYPSIQFYPARRKADSVSYPEFLPKTLPNLIKFILKYSTKSLKLQTVLGTCTQPCVQHNKKLVRQRIQNLAQDIEMLNNRRDKFKKHLKTIDAAQIDDSAIISHQEYISVLHRRIDKRQLQLKNSKNLLKVLYETQDRFMSEKQLHILVENYETYKSKLKLKSSLSTETAEHDSPQNTGKPDKKSINVDMKEEL